MSLRMEFIQAYGGKCMCCGESHPEFLTLEHLRKDGAIERQNGRQTLAVYRELKMQGWPQQDRYALYCWNCNLGSRFLPGCPHKREATPLLFKEHRWIRLKHGEMGDAIIRLLEMFPEGLKVADIHEKLSQNYHCSKFSDKMTTAIQRFKKKGIIERSETGIYKLKDPQGIRRPV